MEPITNSPSQYLMDEFERRVRVNPRYSLRAFARTLGFSAGALSEVLRGRRPLSAKAAVRVVKALGLGRGEAHQLYSFIESERRGEVGNAARPDPAAKKLSEDVFSLVAEWQHFAILNLMDCQGFRWRAQYIARRLGLSLAQAEISMKLLAKLRLVIIENGNAKPAHDFVLSPDGVPSAAVREYHRQMLTKALQALELQTTEERDITGLGLAIDLAQLPQIKRDISDFQDQLAAKYARGHRNEVFFLETALFRLSKGEEK